MSGALKLNNRGNSLVKVGVVFALTGLIVTVADQDNIGWGMGLGLAAYVPMFLGLSLLIPDHHER